MPRHWDTRVEGNTDDRKALYMILCDYSPFGSILGEGRLLGVDRPAKTVDVEVVGRFTVKRSLVIELSVSDLSRNLLEARVRKEAD